MFAASVVFFVVFWLKQDGFPSHGEERQHRRTDMHFAHRGK